MKEIKTYRKIAILIALLVFAVELVWVYKHNLNVKRTAISQAQNTSDQQDSVKLPISQTKKTESLLPGKAKFSLQEKNQQLFVMVNSLEAVDAVDIVLKYDPKSTDFSEISSANNAYKLVLSDNDKAKGELKASLIKSGKSLIGDNLSLLKIDFKAIKPEAKVTFKFKLGKSNDSNVFVNGEAVDVLSAVSSITLK